MIAENAVLRSNLLDASAAAGSPRQAALPDREAIEAAATLVYRALPATPQYAWPLLAARLGARAWLKHENHTPTGAFKVRGGLVYLDGLRRRDPACTDIVSATRGNHGQSLAFAARRLGMTAHIVVPRGNSPEKNAAMVGLGARLIEHGDDFSEASGHAQALAAAHGWHRVPSFHADLVSGVATGWMEFFRAVPDLHRVFVPIGLGSGLCAAIAARRALGLNMALVGVVSAHARAYALSLPLGQPIESPADTRIADGLAVRQPDAQALAMMRGEVERIIEVTDVEVEAAMRALFTDTHQVAEGAGAASLAAALQLALSEPQAIGGLNIGLTLSGGNVDRDVFARTLAADSAADQIAT